MRVLVTGATGQIGGATAAVLCRRGFEVRCLVRAPERAAHLTAIGAHLVQGDVCAPETLARAVEGQDAVIHAAGVVSYWAPRAEEQRRVNVEGTRDLLDAAARAGVRRFVLTSSIAALGYVSGDGMGDEETPFNWQGMNLPYMETKKAAQDLVLQDDRLEGIAVLPGIVFGPGDIADNGLRILRQVAQGALSAAPSGATTAATLADVVDGHLAALARGVAGRAYILGGWTGPYRELFATAAKVVGVAPPSRVAGPALLNIVGALQELRATMTKAEPPLTRALARVSVQNRMFRSDRARSELGYAPRPIAVGMEDAVAWAKENGRWP